MNTEQPLTEKVAAQIAIARLSPIAGHQPSPTRSKQGARHIECPGYRACLLMACRLSWSGFSCTRCPVREADVRVDRRGDLVETAWRRNAETFVLGHAEQW
jgi:hypothetical protein